MIEYSFESLGPTLRYVALGFLIVGLFAAIAILVVIAALPGRIAAARSHPQAAAVNICGWLGLPTGVLWVVAMTWAFWNFDDGSGNATVNSKFLNSLSKQIDSIENSLGKLESQSGRAGS